jgi:hypothetical protein
VNINDNSKSVKRKNVLYEILTMFSTPIAALSLVCLCVVLSILIPLLSEIIEQSGYHPLIVVLCLVVLLIPTILMFDTHAQIKTD